MSLDFGGREGDGIEISEYLVKQRVPHLVFLAGKSLKSGAGKELCDKIKNDPEFKKYVKIGNHSYSHKGFEAGDSRSYLESEIVGNEAKIKQACGGSNFVKVFRYPKGQTHPVAEEILAANGYSSSYSAYSEKGKSDEFSVGWTSDTKDWLEEGGASVWAQENYFKRHNKFMPVSENSKRALKRQVASAQAAPEIARAIRQGREPETFNSGRHRTIEGWHGPSTDDIVEKILNDEGVNGVCVPLTHFGGYNTLAAFKRIIPALKLRDADFMAFEEGGRDRLGDFLKSMNLLAPESPVMPSSCSSCPEEGRAHVVRRGDTLFSIGRKYGIPVSNIREFNNLAGNEIVPGQKLLLAPVFDVYHVRPGDTLFSISKRFNTSVESLKSDNNLSSNEINIGQKLYIDR